MNYRELVSERINYADLIERGFNRIECHDTVFYDEMGYDYFVVQKVIYKNHSKQVMLEWDTVNHHVNMIITDNDGGNIKGRIDDLTLEDIDNYITFFGTLQMKSLNDEEK